MAAAAAGRVGFPRGRAEPEFVVDFRRWRGGFGIAALRAVGRGGDGGVDLAEASGTGQPGGALEGAHRALLRAVLQHHAVAIYGIHQRTAFRDGVGHGFFQIDVLAGADRRQRDERVPVVGHGDRDGVDVIACEQLAEIPVGGAVFVALGGIRPRLGGGACLAVHIADGHQPGFRQAGPGARMITSALIAQTDHAETESPRWRRNVSPEDGWKREG
jgi:hypothetical protein